jgi:hypothetical protein
MIYLASPYSFSPPTGYAIALMASAYLIKRQRHVISPIVLWHTSAQRFNLPTTADFWWDYNLDLLERCDKLVVVEMPPHTQMSRGVILERQWWRENRPESPEELLPLDEFFDG